MLHPNQQKIAKSKARFKVLVCGRRFGKTTYTAEEMPAYAIYQPYPVRYFATTGDQARDIVWNDLLEKVINTPNFVKKDEQRLEIYLRSHLGFTNKIKLAGWDNIETARGKNAGLLVLDEVDSMRNFDGAWNEILRPLLSDTKGHAIFAGTPKGYKTLYRLSQKPLIDEDYEYFHFTSYDNPLLDPMEIDKARREMSPNQFAQEYLAQFKKMEGLVYEEFDRDRHVRPRPFEVDRWGLCIDFGYNHPLAAYLLAISADDHIHVERELYQPGLDDVQRLAKLRALIGDTSIDVAVADSEDPIAIVALERELMVNLKPATKGKDSVLSGINKVKAMLANGELTIDPSCTGLIWEAENYAWKLDTEGHATDQPIKEGDDGVDSVRYGVMAIRHELTGPPIVFV